MPYYKARIVVKPIDREYGFVAENLEEANVRMEEYFDRAVSENTSVCKVVEQ